jgi:transposase
MWGEDGVVNLLEKNEVINGYLRGESKSAIAKKLGKSRKTVRKYINEYLEALEEIETCKTIGEKEAVLMLSTQKPKYQSGIRSKPKMTVEIESEILKCLEENEVKITNGQRKLIMKRTDIHEYLIARGFDISYRSVAAFVTAKLNKSKEAFIKQDYVPGYSVEFDWADVTLDIAELGGVHRLKIGVFTFKNSDYRYALLCTNENTECFMECHRRFFEAVGGVPKEMVYDNAKVQLRRMTGSEKKPTQALLNLSSYYGFDPRFTNYYKGNEKGNVERSVEVVRRKAFCTNICFSTIAAAESALMSAVAKNNATTKQRTGISADAAFAQEVKFLAPARLPMDVSTVTEASVNKYSLVYVDTHFYSVPEFLSEKKVVVRKYPDKLSFYYNDECLFKTERILKGKNKYRIDINHYLETLKKKPGAIKHSLALKQAVPWLQDIFQKYYGQIPRDFILLLEIIKSHSLAEVQVAVTKLELRNLPVSNSYIRHELANEVQPISPVIRDDDEIQKLCQHQLLAIASLYGLGGVHHESAH